MKGKLIVFEGIDGSGKSSAIVAAHHFLASKGVPSIITRQPGGTVVGEKLRDIVKTSDMSPITEVLLFASGFEESIRQLIKPALEQGTWVLCDRYKLTTQAYQSGGRGVPLDTVRNILSNITQLPPELTILFDVPAHVAAERIAGRGDLDRFETEGIAFQEKIRRFFLDAIALEGNHKILSTEALDQEATTREVCKILAEVIG